MSDDLDRTAEPKQAGPLPPLPARADEQRTGSAFQPAPPEVPKASRWIVPVTVLLVLAGLASFCFSAYCYVSGVTGRLAAGEKALDALGAMVTADVKLLAIQPEFRAMKEKEAKTLAEQALDAQRRSDELHARARCWGFGGLFPLLTGLVLMIVYRRQRALARRVR
ncbi:MAG: hypothetical protein FJ098_11675 [Deltaproteobacteria bacterium]|nr:hypothetical protein [Deltaproteobacteria bacterium]